MPDDSSSRCDGICAANEATKNSQNMDFTDLCIWILLWYNIDQNFNIAWIFISPLEVVINKNVNGYFLFSHYFFQHYQILARKLEEWREKACSPVFQHFVSSDRLQDVWQLILWLWSVKDRIRKGQWLKGFT